MNEPSLLDYLKSKLSPWQTEELDLPDIVEEEPAGSPRPASVLSKYSSLKDLPWRTIFSFALALFGQRLLEPPVESYFVPAGYYLLAVIVLGWALAARELRLPDTVEQSEAEDPLTLRRNWFIAAMLFSVLAFVFFTNNLFSTLNVSLWLAAITCLVISLTITDWRANLAAAGAFFTRPYWSLPVTRWGVLLLAVFAVAAFFRFYDLTGTPAEPFSDHAEKLLDVYNVTQGQSNIFFVRNTGREFLQMYWTAFVGWASGTGISFMSLKLGTALLGFFALPFIYMLGRDLFNRRVGLFALLLSGMAYWLNVTSRVGLRFPLFPAFTAPVLFFILRGLRNQNRNDFIWAGLFLGLGLHGYSSFRIVPFVVAAAILLYLIHTHSVIQRRQAVLLLAVVALAAFLVFLPLLRVMIEMPDMVLYRAMTRIAETERPLPGPAWQILLENIGKSMLMMNVDNGIIWVHSVPLRPALDVVSGVFFAFGYLMLFVRYLRKRDWLDLFLLLAVPMLMLSSSLSLAFPEENPSLNRSGGAAIVVFLIAALALDGLYSALRESASRWGRGMAFGLVGFLLVWSGYQNYDLVLNQYSSIFRYSAWNTSEMGRVITAFEAAGNSLENAFVVPYPHWVDTRLVGVWAGYPTRDFALWREQLGMVQNLPGGKMFLVKEDDTETLDVLRALYPNGSYSLYNSRTPGKNFWIVFVPPAGVPALP